MTAYYSENDPHAAAWLRNLIAEGHIAPGDVDERSILDVRPADLAGFKQCHFFAGIGVWSYALRQAGWPDDREIWTGSCPCQPFSAAGKGDGFADERHLWPAFFWLIEQCRPARIMGEQVASKDGLAWLDLVLSDLEGADYAAGALDLGAAGVGAPHIRQRLWWMADAKGQWRRERPGEIQEAAGEDVGAVAGQGHGNAARTNGATDLLADAHGQRSEHPQQCAGGQRPSKRHIDERHGPSDLLADAGHTEPSARREDSDHGTGAGGDGAHRAIRHELAPCVSPVGLVDTAVAGRQGLADGRGTLHPQRAAVERASGDAGGVGDAELLRRDQGLAGDDRAADRARSTSGTIIDRSGGMADAADGGHQSQPSGAGVCEREVRFEPVSEPRDIRTSEQPIRPGPTNGFWRDADWLRCRDGKWRPVEPGTSPLASGIAGRVGRLRAYGNALCAPAAVEVIAAMMDVLP